MIDQLEIRLATKADIRSIMEIFNRAIETTTASFYTEPRAEQEIEVWLGDLQGRYRTLVAVVDDQVAGFVKLGRWSDRAAYDHTGETTIYVAESMQGQGIGKLLQTAINADAREDGFQTLIARIAEGGEASLRMHRQLGFKLIGTMRNVGYKFGRLLDVYILQLMLDEKDVDLRVGWMNGKMVDESELAIPVSDLGFSLGVGVSERIRTFGGIPHLLEEHLERFLNGAMIVGLDLKYERGQLEEFVRSVTSHNFLADKLEQNLSLVATGGKDGNLVIYSQPIPAGLWREKYGHGVRLITAETREIPAECLPKRVKHRNRLHYWLAQQEVEKKQAGAIALMLDLHGNIAETPAASIFALEDSYLIAAPEEDILQSTSLGFFLKLAKSLGTEVRREKISRERLVQCDEVFICNSIFCLAAVIEIDGVPIKDGQPGAMFERLRQAWKDRVGFDFADG